MNEKVEIDREELARLRADSAELARVRAESWSNRAYDAALAAKDARIAELEQKNDNLHAVMSAMELSDAMRHERAQRHEPVAYVLFRDGEVCYEADDNIVISNFPGDSSDLYQWLPVFTNPTMAKNANVAATPSEDGGEVPEVVGHLLLGGYADQVELEDNDIELDMKIVERLQTDQLLINGDGVQLPLMTVAQHSRIVAAKDAEIAELDALRNRLSDLLSQSVIAIRGPEPELTRWGYADLPQRVKTVVAELEQLRAQPARQVGGDEPYGYLREVDGQAQLWVGSEKPADRAGGHATPWVPIYASPQPAGGPAAVVMPERTNTYIGDRENQAWAAGHNYALDEVARLNRNAIPVELLEQAASMLEAHSPGSGSMESYCAQDIRALLGKE